MAVKGSTEKAVEVLYSDIEEAYANWNKYFGLNEYHTFWKFLGVKSAPGRVSGNWRSYYFPAYIRPRLNMLLGPYHAAIIKTHRIRTLTRGK